MRSFERGWLFVQGGFDRSELSMVHLDIMVCPQHKEFSFHFALLGLWLNLFITEPFDHTRKDDDGPHQGGA